MAVVLPVATILGATSDNQHAWELGLHKHNILYGSVGESIKTDTPVSISPIFGNIFPDDATLAVNARTGLPYPDGRLRYVRAVSYVDWLVRRLPFHIPSRHTSPSAASIPLPPSPGSLSPPRSSSGFKPTFTVPILRHGLTAIDFYEPDYLDEPMKDGGECLRRETKDMLDQKAALAKVDDAALFHLQASISEASRLATEASPLYSVYAALPASSPFKSLHYFRAIKEGVVTGSGTTKFRRTTDFFNESMGESSLEEFIIRLQQRTSILASDFADEVCHCKNPSCTVKSIDVQYLASYVALNAVDPDLFAITIHELLKSQPDGKFASCRLVTDALLRDQNSKKSFVGSASRDPRALAAISTAVVPGSAPVLASVPAPSALVATSSGQMPAGVRANGPARPFKPCHICKDLGMTTRMYTHVAFDCDANPKSVSFNAQKLAKLKANFAKASSRPPVAAAVTTVTPARFTSPAYKALLSVFENADSKAMSDQALFDLQEYAALHP